MIFRTNSASWLMLTAILAMFCAGCKSTRMTGSYPPARFDLSSSSGVASAASVSDQSFAVEQASWEPQDEPAFLQSEVAADDVFGQVAPPPADDIPPAQDFPGCTTLPQLEQLALESNPGITGIEARIEALRGKQLQAGLAPNPRAGYQSEEIGLGGAAGRHGLFVGRQVVRGNKLGRSQAVVCAEIETAMQDLGVQRQKVLNDVRSAYYNLLISRQKVFVASQLVEVSQNAVDVSTELFGAGESSRTAVLQSELELQKAMVLRQQAVNEQQAATTQLAALFGESELPVPAIEGDPFNLIELEGFEDSFSLLVNSSPEIAALFAEVEQARKQLDRARVEPVPDVTWQANVLYDTLVNEVVTGVQVGMPIPVTNRNQGAIHQAQHEIVAAERAVEVRALQLRQRLTLAYEQYIDARVQIDRYRSEVLPRAETTLELFSKGYRSGEVDFLQLLTAQRTYSELSMAYLDKLKLLWQQYVAIKGMLLSGSLDQTG